MSLFVCFKKMVVFVLLEDGEEKFSMFAQKKEKNVFVVLHFCILKNF